MKVVTTHVAETRLSQPLIHVQMGEKVVLARGGQSVAKLVPFRAPASKRRFDALRGKIGIGPEFFEGLLEEELQAWKA